VFVVWAAINLLLLQQNIFNNIVYGIAFKKQQNLSLDDAELSALGREAIA
jgi:hypothetical protein